MAVLKLLVKIPKFVPLNMGIQSHYIFFQGILGGDFGAIMDMCVKMAS